MINKDNKPVDNRFNAIKIIFLLVYNFVIIWIVAATDWGDWGAILMWPIVLALILIGTPLLTLILFLKSNNKGNIILISTIATIIISGATSFLFTGDNIQNLISNNYQKNEVKKILNNGENVKFNSNDKFDAYINPEKKKIYFVFHNPYFGASSPVIIQRKRHFQEYDLIETNHSINEANFNRNLLYTKEVNYNATINVKYTEFEDKEVNVKINNNYYNIDYKIMRSDYNWERVLDNNLLQKKLFTLSGVEEYENRGTSDSQYVENPYTFLEFYYPDDFEYFIIKDKERKYEFYNDIEKIYKCFSKDKTDMERLSEFDVLVKEKYEIRDGSKPEILNTKTFNLNNNKIEKIIIYDDEYNNSWIEILLKNYDFSIFTRLSNMPDVDRREIR